MEDFLTTDMTYPKMEENFSSYLGDQYAEDEWKEAQDVLFSSDGDNNVTLENLHAVKAKHISPASCVPKDHSVMDRRLCWQLVHFISFLARYLYLDHLRHHTIQTLLDLPHLMVLPLVISPGSLGNRYRRIYVVVFARYTSVLFPNSTEVCISHSSCTYHRTHVS
jgi:hypothetical protein